MAVIFVVWKVGRGDCLLVSRGKQFVGGGSQVASLLLFSTQNPIPLDTVSSRQQKTTTLKSAKNMI